MYFYQYILLAGFTCLLFNREVRFAASVFLSGWLIYLVVTIDIPYALYFCASATIETAIAGILNARYRLISYLGYSLILVNFAGLLLHINGIKVYYDFVYAIISITQFLLLLARAIPNGVGRLHIKHLVVRAVNFDSRGAYDRMYKNSNAQGKN